MITASVVLASALAGGAGWIAGYFAKEAELRHFQCLADSRAELLDLRMLANNFYSRYLNAKLEVARLSDAASEEERVQLAVWKDRQARFRRNVKQRDTEAKQLAKRIEGDKCGPRYKWESRR